MKNKIKFYKFCKVASKVLIGLLIALVVLCVAALIFRACTPAENNVAYASEADGVGVWLWNDDISFTGTNEFRFNFTSGDSDYIGLTCSYDEYNEFSILAYIYLRTIPGQTPSEAYFLVYEDNASDFWGSYPEYQTVDIKTAPPADFLTILNANATYQGGTPTTYTVTKQATDCSIIGADSAESGQTYNYQIAPNTGFGYPNDVQVFGAEKTYNNLTGQLTISNVTGNVTIIARATGSENVVGFWKWDNTLSDISGMLGGYEVDITANNEHFNKISFTASGEYQTIYYREERDDGSATQVRVYQNQMQPAWSEEYQTFYLNKVPNNKFLNYLQLNAEYLGTTPQYTVSGNNVLQSLLTYADSAAQDGATNFSQGIQFTTQDGANWSKIVWEYYIDTDYERTIKHRLYYGTADAEPVQVWETETGWANIAYRFVNFGNTPVAVTQNFSDWITANKIEETGYTLQGKFYFPNEINFTGGNVDGELQFVDGSGSTYWGIRWIQSSKILEYGEYSENVNGYVGVYDGTTNTRWNFDEYKTIDFGNVPQPVTKAFLDFINAVALTDVDVNNPLYQFGYDAGKIDGIQQGLDDAKEIVTPNSASWIAGYEKGFADATDNSLLDGPKAIFGSVLEILNINLFGIPGFTVGAIVAIVVALGVLLFILKIIRG